MSKKVSKIILICAIAIIIPIAIIATVMSCSGNNTTLLLSIDYAGSGVGTVEGNKEAGYKSGEQATLTAIPNSSSEFVQWLDGSNDLGKETVLTLKVEKKMTITAKFDKKTYNVSFIYDNGSENKSETLSYGATLPVVTKAGYAFDGWEIKRGDEVLMVLPAETLTADFNTIDSGDLTLTAKWVKLVKVTLNYGADYTQPEGTVVETEFRDGSKIGTKLPFGIEYFTSEVKDTKKIIRGWEDASGNKYTPETVYAASEGVDEITLNAIWTEAYKVSFVASGSTEIHSSIFLAVDDKITYPESFNKKGYEFTGKFKVDGSEFNSTTLPQNLAKPITIEIVLDIITYDIEYIGITAEQVTALNLPTTFNVNDGILIADKLPTKDHYEFVNYTAGEKVVTTIDSSYIDNTDWSKENNKLIITANFKAVEYDIVFNYGAHEEAFIDADKIGKYTVETNDFKLKTVNRTVTDSATDYVFDGWYKENTFVNRVLQSDIDSENNKGNPGYLTNDKDGNPTYTSVTLYAKWIPQGELKFTFDTRHYENNIAYPVFNKGTTTAVSNGSTHTYANVKDTIAKMFTNHPDYSLVLEKEYTANNKTVTFKGWSIYVNLADQDGNISRVNLKGYLGASVGQECFIQDAISDFTVEKIMVAAANAVTNNALDGKTYTVSGYYLTAYYI